VDGEEALRKAVQRVFESAGSERVAAYSQAQGIQGAHRIAVVVQRMVAADLAGVLFTADPVTGSHERMVGNFVEGLGEVLVSGEANAHAFTLSRPGGRYDGPAALKRHARALFRLAGRIHDQEGGPQDIEWAVSKGKLYILQSRPVTTLRTLNRDTYEVNESLDKDFMWTSFNVSEAVPDVMSPFTWSLIRALDLETTKMTGYYIWSGNICGRVYTNISIVSSFLQTFGVRQRTALKLVADAFGNAPADAVVPRFPMGFGWAAKEMSARAVKNIRRVNRAMKNRSRYLEKTPAWCDDMEARIRKAGTPGELKPLWEEIRAYASEMWDVFLGGASGAITMMALRSRLTKLVDQQDAGALMSHLRGGEGLESMGPLVGLDAVRSGRLDRAEYLRRYGHRSPHEFEVLYPYPRDDPDWLNRQLQQAGGMDVDGLLAAQQARFDEAVARFNRKYPGRRDWLQKQLQSVAKYAQIRESIRSEFVRVFRVIRLFLVKLGALAGIGEGVFMLYVDEIPALLNGDRTMLQWIEARRASFERYRAMPPFPPFIRGRFEPERWMRDPLRRMDSYDASAPAEPGKGGDVLTGFSGAAGRVEGPVRVLRSFEEGDQLRPGEILVAATTNVGWTPLFPRAAAIVTDIGAPLSHAAIVARELGKPAVVGVNVATSRLQTGDRVLVDGGAGTVRIVSKVRDGETPEAIRPRPSF
jgi:pyruvate,water dikinase